MSIRAYAFTIALLLFSAGSAWYTFKIIEFRTHRMRYLAPALIGIYALVSVLIVVSNDASQRRPVASFRVSPTGPAVSGMHVEGIYKDGWAKPRVQVKLASQPSDGSRIYVHGSLPPGVGITGQRVALQADGKVLAETPLNPGYFSIGAPINAKMQDVSLSFATARRLSGNDNRQVAAMVQSISVFPNGEGMPDEVRSIPSSLTNPRLQFQGIFSDGWVGKEAAITLASRGVGTNRLSVHGFIPKDMGLDGQQITVSANGKVLVKKALGQGEFTVSARVPIGLQNIVLQFNVLHRASKNDSRMVSARLQSVVIN